MSQELTLGFYMIEIYKAKYKTCLESLNQFRIDNPDFKEEILSYNGILDPMAEGVLPILVGEEENNRRKDFTGSKKVYRVGVLIGVSTDSSDLLGVVNSTSSVTDIDINLIIKAFLDHERVFDQVVPMHSNRKVNGKRLWWWMLNGIVIPKEKRPVNSVEILDIKQIIVFDVKREELEREIDMMSKMIGERFRLSMVTDSWNKFFEWNNEQSFKLVEFELYVSSGFYVRAFVERISERLDIPMTVFSLKRTKVVFN